MRRLSLAVEELMGAMPAAPAQAGAAPGMMGPSKPKIALKGQPGAGGTPAGNMPADPKAAGSALAAALAGAGGAIQNSIDAGVNQANMRQGNPDTHVQGAQPQPARTTPQQRMQQQRDELALKKGNLPRDLTDDVAKIAQQQKPGMPQRPGVQQPGQPPMEAVTEAEGTFKKTHEFVTTAAKHAYRSGKNTSAGTWDHRHYSKNANGAWKHESEHGYDGHESKEDAAEAAKADRDWHDKHNSATVKEGKVPNPFKPDGKMSNPDDTNGFDKVTAAQAKATAKHKAAIKGDAKLGGSTLKKESGRGTQWQAVRPGKLKSTTVKEDDTTVLGDEGRKAILDEFFA